ncbi:hypothetical protein ACF0H5_013869 [Mactra antiquata]
MDFKVTHHLYPNFSITLALYKDVTNMEALRQCVMKGEFEATLLKPSMICDPFIVLTAANRAVYLDKTNKMTTKNVHSEVLYCLSPTKNITDSFRKFGVGDKDNSVFIVLLNDLDGAKMEFIKSKIEGCQISIDEVSNFKDETQVKKIYKVTDLEVNTCSLSDVIVSRVASKEFLTV